MNRPPVRHVVSAGAFFPLSSCGSEVRLVLDTFDLLLMDRLHVASIGGEPPDDVVVIPVAPPLEETVGKGIAERELLLAREGVISPSVFQSQRTASDSLADDMRHECGAE